MIWSLKDLPPQTGKLVVITGASGGLGMEVARTLTDKGAQVIVAARDAAKGAAAVAALGPSARFEALDLADLTSVQSFAAIRSGIGQPIDLLINNAGLASPPKRLTTRDGFELQFGTNFLGHFALTARLLPLLQQAAAPRVVTVSSLVANSAKLNFGDLMSEQRYSPISSYGQSKLANLIFARELQRQADAHGWGLRSVAAHPGIARTELTKSRPGQAVLRLNVVFDLLFPLFGQDVANGALPILYAATAEDASPGGYYGPTGSGERRGPVGVARSSPVSRDPQIADRLWKVAEELTGTNF